MSNAKLKKMIESAKVKFKDQKHIIEMIEEMEQDVSLESVIKGTELTLRFMEDRDDK